MARKKNATFQGTLLQDADAQASSYTRAVASIAGDVALTFDKITGQNGELVVTDRTGGLSSARGAKLSIPIINQYIGRRLTLWNIGASTAHHGGPGETNIVAVPFFLPGGVGTREGLDLVLEVLMTLDVFSPQTLNPRCLIYNLAGSKLVDEPMQILPSATFGSRERLFTDLSGLLVNGGQYLLFVRITTTSDPPLGSAAGGGGGSKSNVGTLHSVMMHASAIGDHQKIAKGVDSPYSAWTPAAAEGLGHRNFDAALFTDRYALSAYELVGLDRNLNSLLEYITGWPAGTNGTYTQQDQDGGGAPDATDPARSRFLAHTRASYAATEPEIDFPMCTVAVGAAKTDGGLVVQASNTPNLGMLDWFTPWPTNVARNTIDQVDVIWPDFQTTSSKLKAMVLLGSDGAADANDWTAYIRTGNGLFEKTFPAITSVLIPGSPNYYWVSSVDIIPFLAETQDTVELRLQKTIGALQAIGQIYLLGWCFYFDP